MYSVYPYREYQICLIFDLDQYTEDKKTTFLFLFFLSVFLSCCVIFWWCWIAQKSPNEFYWWNTCPSLLWEEHLNTFSLQALLSRFLFERCNLARWKRKLVEMQGLISDYFGGLKKFIQIQCLRQKKVLQWEENLLFICPYSVIICNYWEEER